MGKQKFKCNICGKVLSGGRARREHCQMHHPGISLCKLDAFFDAEYSEIDDETYRELSAPSITIISPTNVTSAQSSEESNEKSTNIPGWIRGVLSNGDNVFITGKAGTGKTTLLKEIVKDLKSEGKNAVILAPTGVAAKNAGGVTIHSFLRLPISPYLPNVKMKDLYKLPIEGINAIKHVDTIIIDEISMVRCDLLDMVDNVLRHYRGSNAIFGGVRIIAFGDLFQLMPVVTSKDWPLLKEWYRSPYFFSSKVYEDHPFRMITLRKVYRQTDSDFLGLLNEVRYGDVSKQNLSLLEKRYQESSKAIPKEGVIRLTTHNRLAKDYNERVFSTLPGYEYEYKAIISGYVHSVEYPTTYTLNLKKGARVMFIKNDTSSAKLYVNGTLGTVTRCDEESVSVKIDGSDSILRVTPQTWYFDEYIYNKNTHTLDLQHRGSFKQIPLKLAWAITIHKSQGLTFDKVIIDAGKAFTYGQVYVALSRCRKFEGITLATPITADVIQTDPIVKHFMSPKQDNEELPAFTIKKKSTRKPKKPDNLHGLKLLKWLAENDYTIEEMSKETGYNSTSLVYHDLCKLISIGKLGLACRLSIAKINDIKNAWLSVGLSAELQAVKPLCKTDANFGEIQMVRSYLEYISK
jgi:Cdc6-like AAA superfamily ATPase